MAITILPLYASSYARNILPRLVRVMSKRKRSYDTATKLQAVEVAEKKSKEAAARQFSVDPRRIVVLTILHPKKVSKQLYKRDGP